MATLLPELPRGDFRFRFISNHLDLQPSGGGETQRVNRLGDRFAFETSFKVLGVQGIGLIAVLNANKCSKVRVYIPQTVAVGSPGSSVLVNGANSGQSLVLKGVAASNPFTSGQFITIVKSGKRYLHQVVANATASGGGAVTLTIVPTLRIALTGDEVVEVATPSIEGFLTARETEWVTHTGHNSVAMTISVMEAE